jgi:hypothetical protein
MKVGIFTTPEGFENTAISACKEMKIDYEVIDLFSPDWVNEYRCKPCDGYLLRPASYTSIWRNVYLRRLYLLRHELEGRCVPTLDSILYYESKILMTDLYKLANIPHPITKTFFRFCDAWNYTSVTSLPKIVKTDGGSAGVGVQIVRSRLLLRWQVIRSFLTRNVQLGLHSIYDLKKVIGGFLMPWFNFLKNRNYFKAPDVSQGYIVIQEVINVIAEWRIVVIGNSYFGHIKGLGKNQLRSGSDVVDWTPPPFNLLDLVRGWYEALRLNAMTFDIFEDANGNYFVNEMQAVMGAKKPSQMYIRGIPGRYLPNGNKWIFEEGEFCRHSCNMLRIETLRDLIEGCDNR